MLTPRLVAATLFAGAFLLGSSQAETLTRKVQFNLKPGQHLGTLLETGRWEIVEAHGNRVVALEQVSDDGVAAEDITVLERTIATQEFVVLSGNIDDELASFRAKGSEGAYHSVAENEAELKALAQAHPEICHVESLGKTFEQRDIWGLRIGSHPENKDLPRVLLFGLVHAREWISAELPHHAIRSLVAGYGQDEELTELIDSRIIWVIPVTNPDGLEYAQTNYSMWRKNRNKVVAMGTGVDVNRNFEVGFGTGSSGWGNSDVYRGPHAGSEAETQSLLALMERERFSVSLSFHSYSELILYPWGYTDQDPPHKDIMSAHGQAMKNFNGYRHGSVAQILYSAGGATDDTFFTKYGCWSWTFELARQFVPPETQIESICQQNWPAVLHIIRSAQDLKDSRPQIGPQAGAEGNVAVIEKLIQARANAANAHEAEEASRALDGVLEVMSDRAREDDVLKSALWKKFGQSIAH